MHVFLTGGTGFVGSYVLQALLEAGHTARCLVRSAEVAEALASENIETVKADVLKPKSLKGTMRGCDAVIHLVGIIEAQPAKGLTFDRVHHEGTMHVVDEAQDSDIEVFLQMSANGARADGVSAYQTSKWAAEEYVRAAGFRHATIFRPSIIYGDPRPDNPEFASQLARDLIRPFPVLPVFGDGQYGMQPVAVETVATAFAQALTRPRTAGKSYCVAGHTVYPYTEILDIITRGCGLEPKVKIPQPLWLVRPVIQLAGQFDLLPITIDQFEMLVEGNTCDSTAFFEDFDVEDKPFTPENLSYLVK